MWIRKSDRDRDRDRETGKATPVPTQIVGNEEFEPLPQTPDQRRVEARIFELADHYSGKLGISRRAFLRTSGGMAVSFLAMNEVFGPAFLVSEAEAAEPAASREMWPKKEFILDLQTHHVKDTMAGSTVFRSMTGRFGLNPVLAVELGLGLGPFALSWAIGVVGWAAAFTWCAVLPVILAGATFLALPAEVPPELATQD